MSPNPKKKTMKKPEAAAPVKIAASVGALLERGRLELGLTLPEAAARLKIPEATVAALETGDCAKLPDDVYSRIHLKAYCRLLNLDIRATVQLYRQERHRAARHPAGSYRRHPSAGISFWQMLAAPRAIRSLAMIALAAGLGGYIVWSIINIITPPRVIVNTPHDGMVTAERQVAVEGRTDREVSLLINGKPVAPDSLGNFHDSLELQSGLNVVRVVASRKHSKETTVTRRVIVEPADGVTAMR